jgi:hypothetical protein
MTPLPASQHAESADGQMNAKNPPKLSQLQPKFKKKQKTPRQFAVFVVKKNTSRRSSTRIRKRGSKKALKIL